MKLDQYNNQPYPVAPENRSESTRVPPPPIPRAIPVYVPPAQAGPARKGSSFLLNIVKYLFVMIFITSLLLNFYLGALFLQGGLSEQEYRPGKKSQRIALIDLAGSIDMETQYQFQEMLRQAEKDDTVEGVIIVVNSPGGQVVPSDMMNQYVKAFQKKGKKIYASIQQVGASGAYWATAGVDRMYAQPNSMVGSIGVIYINLVLKEALEQKLGISPVVIKSSRSAFKDRGSPFRHPSEEDISEIQQDLDKIHQQFVHIVKDGRHLDEEQVWKLASGDVFDGEEALGKNLVDEIGFLDDVIDALTEEIGLENPQVIRYFNPPSLKEILFAKSAEWSDSLDIEKQWEKWATTPRIQALWLGQ